MAKPLMWMVRAGEGGYLAEEFRKGSFAAIGWNELGDLTGMDSQDGIYERYVATFPGDKPARVGNAAAMVFKFRSVLKPGQKVTTYNPDTRQYLVGTITGDYVYAPDRQYHHVRSVDWLGTVDRDSLKAASRNSLGSVLTLFQINEETADDLLNRLNGKAADEAAVVSEEKEELEQLKEDTINRAHELIKDRLLKLDDEEMELLVAAILRAMGYKARVTPKGPDRGVDVIASPDGLGLEEPRIKAEVKHRPKTQMGSQEIRSFLGGLRQGDRALYVSTGGFSKDAGYEADRSNIPITLLTLDDLASLVVTHYENFDMDGKVLIPLTRLYWPVE
jgi:restriction system protein